MRLYLDTSVLGAMTDRDDPARQEITRGLIAAVRAGTHIGVISNVVQEEIDRAPSRVREAIVTELRDAEFELLVESEESRALFRKYMAARIIGPRCRDDLRHVAVASHGRVDALVSWNFRHLVNVRTRRAINAVNLRLAYPLIEIVSPQEV